MKIVKRDNEFNVEMLDNGFLFTASGRDDGDDWETAKVFYPSLEEMFEAMKLWTTLPKS